jgi:hypothetical protein
MINGTVIGASPGASTSAPGASPGASTLGILPSFPTFNQFFGLGSVNWQDVTIRSALVLVGIIIALIVVVKFLQTPEIEEVPENEDS